MRIYERYILATGRQFYGVFGFATIADRKSGQDRNHMHGKIGIQAMSHRHKQLSIMQQTAVRIQNRQLLTRCRAQEQFKELSDEKKCRKSLNLGGKSMQHVRNATKQKQFHVCCIARA
ncbi:MAG: hypothetical protein ABIR56_06050 [Polaromonas sp.]